MERRKGGVCNVCFHPLSLSHMQLSSRVHLAKLPYLDAKLLRTGQLWFQECCTLVEGGACEYMQIGHRISIGYPQGYTVPKRRVVYELGVSSAAQDTDQRFPGVFSSRVQFQAAIKGFDSSQHTAGM